MDNVELLAPVGSMESLYAAVQNGCDAVYLGGKLFNARKYASNFENDELKYIVSYCHLRRVKVYVTLNILLDDEELEPALDYAKFLHDINVDGVIVQDLGFASLVRKALPELELHGSTQMTINNLEGAQALYDLGFKRVVLARETPIHEIIHIHKNCPIELEVFIHGALCVSYSGQCLMSSFIGGRSGNRGTCAQPCRMPSSLEGPGGQIIDGWEKKHILSPRDLNSLDQVEELIRAGVISLKVEGRMKRPEYVATVVRAYRKVIDYGRESLSNNMRQDVKQIFNRGFTKGLGFGDFGENFISADRPDNRGVLVGNVVRVDKYKIYIKLLQDLVPGDGLEFKVDDNKYRGIKIREGAKKGDILPIEKPFYVRANTPVYKTSSRELLQEAKESFKEDKIKYPIDIEMELKLGKKPLIRLRYRGKTLEHLGEETIEEAKKVSLSESDVISQIGKLGDTVYYINDFNLDLDRDIFMSKSSLNKLRRDIVSKLDSENIKGTRPAITSEDFDVIKSEIMKPNKRRPRGQYLSVKVNSLEQFKQLNLKKLDIIYLNFISGLGEALDILDGLDLEVYISTEKILYRKDMLALEKILDEFSPRIKGVQVNNIGSYQFIKTRYQLDISGDQGLNVFNSMSLKFLEDLGLERSLLSEELNLRQIQNLTCPEKLKVEKLIYGYMPVMTMKHCPMSLVKKCKDDSACETCNYSRGYSIRDRMGVTFKMERKSGFTNIYNSLATMIFDSLDRLRDSVDIFRLDFTIEEDLIKEIQETAYDYIKGDLDSHDLSEFIAKFKETNEITNGHLYRGVME